MNFKDMLDKISQLSETTTKTKGGVKHTADKGGYGRKGDEETTSDESPKASKDTPKGDIFGRTSGEVPDSAKTKKEKKGLKEYFNKVDEMMTQQPIPVVGKQGSTQQTGAGFLNIDDSSPAGQAMKDAIGKLAQQKKAQIVVPTQGQQSGMQQKPTATTGGATNQPAMAEEGGEKWIQKAVKHPGAFTKKAKAAGKSVAAFAKEKAHAPGTLGKQARLAQTLSKISKKKEDMAEGDIPPQDGLMGAGLGAGRDQGVTEGQVNELSDKKLADYQAKAQKQLNRGENVAKRTAGVLRTSHSARRNKGLDPYADTSNLQNYPLGEASKPDFLDLDKDGNKKESMKKAAKDKKKVKEGMDHRLKAAHHAGKSHALSKQGYNCSYDDMEEARMYHEGFKEGLDECYGQVPIRGSVVADEGAMNTVDDMASFGAHTPALEAEVDEMDRTSYMKQKAIKTPGDTFRAFGQTMHDKDVLETDSMFESWDNQLSSLLEEYKEIQEGLSVSVSKGQQGAPDSVSVTAQDADADKLLALVKHAGLGLFGDEGQAEVGVPSGDEQHGGVDVVGDHDGMMALIKKTSGGSQPGTLEPAGADSEDYADEEGHEDHDDGGLDMIKKLTQAIGAGGSDEQEETCESCGSAMEACSCDHAEDQVEEESHEEYMNQEEETVAEDNPPDTGEEEVAATDAEVAADNKAASSHGGADDDEEDELDESYANSDDDGFQADIDFMTKAISGGLNKQKSTGQTTIPVIAGQSDRMGYNVKESVNEWKKLAGL